MCHLSLEKILKAIYEQEFDQAPPKTHNFLYLTKETNTSMPPELFEFVSRINNASGVTRYPEDFKELLKSYPRRIVKEYVSNTEKVLSWLSQRMKSG